MASALAVLRFAFPANLIRLDKRSKQDSQERYRSTERGNRDDSVRVMCI
jgi:hypothetical protein